jgi:exodeoxyribonuclease VII small subunit
MSLANDKGEKENVREKAEEEFSFEEALKELEAIVEQLETGDVPLEKAVALFQKGIKLSSMCHSKLKKVEQEVNILLEEEEQHVFKAFHVEEDRE